MCVYSIRNFNQIKLSGKWNSKKAIMIPIQSGIISLKDNLNSNYVHQ
jgi:hypothetical protein